MVMVVDLGKDRKWTNDSVENIKFLLLGLVRQLKTILQYDIELQLWERFNRAYGDLYKAHKDADTSQQLYNFIEPHIMQIAR